MKTNKNIIKRGTYKVDARIILKRFKEKYGEYITLYKEEYGTGWIAEAKDGKKYSFFVDYLRNPEIMEILKCYY